MIILAKNLIPGLTSNFHCIISRRCLTNISRPLDAYIGLECRKDKISMVDKDGLITYGDLNLMSDKVAKSLHSKLGKSKISKHQHTISLLCDNTRNYSKGLYGIWKSGNIAVPLCNSHPATSLEYCLKDSQSSAIITTKEFLGKINNYVKTSGIKLLLLEDVNKSCCNVSLIDNGDHYDVDMNQDALILYTSGTTGHPKGVVHTHSNIISQVNTMVGPWQWDKMDRILHILPLHHTHGLVNCLLCPLAVGAEVHMLPKFDASSVWNILLSGTVNVFMAVPAVYAKLIEYYHKNESRFTQVDVKVRLLENIRLMVSGSAALPNKVLNDWFDISGHVLLERYGMTEIGMALGNPYDMNSRLPGFVGKPFPGVETRILDEKGSRNILVTGNHDGSIIHHCSDFNDISGDLQIKGPTVFRTYFNKPEATMKEFTKDGWFRTGDVAQYDAAKNAYKIVGRSSVDIIKSGGYKIGALEIERILLEHPSIKDVAVVGVDDETWGQRVGAVIVLKDNSNDSLGIHKLKEWAQDRLPSYSIPTLLSIMEELPRNAMGKVNKKELVKIVFS